MTALVHCESCRREWHSATMAENLRAVDSCPRCGGTLCFSDAAPGPGASAPGPAAPSEQAPHLVLGVPRR